MGWMELMPTAINIGHVVDQVEDHAAAEVAETDSTPGERTRAEWLDVMATALKDGGKMTPERHRAKFVFAAAALRQFVEAEGEPPGSDPCPPSSTRQRERPVSDEAGRFLYQSLSYNPNMANEEHLEILKKGVEVWNSWRKENPEVQLDLLCADLRDAYLSGADLSGTNLSYAKLRGADLRGANFVGTDLRGTDLRETNLIGRTFDGAAFTGCLLWETQRAGWSIKGVICEYVFWDREGKERTDYAPGEFERLHSAGVTVRLHYEGGISQAEISSLPFLLMHLEEAQPGCALRFKSIEDAPGGARVNLVVEETGGVEVHELKAQLEEEGRRLQGATRILLLERQSKQQLEEDFADYQRRMAPILLHVAERSLLPEARRTVQAAVLFSDLNGFSKLSDPDRAPALELLRGLLKPILNRWHGEHPNMWGDALRVTFEDVNNAFECACMIQAAISSQRLTQRIGMDHGEITARYNPTIDGMDIEGDAVNFAARLEPLANPGEVLISEGLRCHPDVDQQRFEFNERTVELKKAVGTHPEGAEVRCYSVSLREPSPCDN